MIVILTSNYNGGIFQLACQLNTVMQKMYGDVVLFAPEECTSKPENMQTYQRINSLSPFTKAYDIVAERIWKYRPELVFVCDSNLITGRVVSSLCKKTNVVMCVHDVNPHPNYSALVGRIKEAAKAPFIRRAWAKCKKILLLSDHSRRDFMKAYPCFRDKLGVMKLGAHVPEATVIQPPEMGDEGEYLLFFGRMDKYKGIINLLKAYCEKRDKIGMKLVIAGGGTLTAEEQKYIDASTDRVILIKRYIEDGEMLWLFNHARCTVLPYIEASQSGVLSMSYYFKKPVIISNLEGLREFVNPGQTGYVYHNLQELGELLVQVSSSETCMAKAIAEYYEENLEWEENVQICLAGIVQ